MNLSTLLAITRTHNNSHNEASILIKIPMINFKKETLKAIQESGHLEEDVMFIGSKD